MVVDNMHVREHTAFAALPKDDLCERWAGVNGFELFMADVGPCAGSRAALCKVYPDRPWAPDNCEWWREKATTMTSKRPVTFRGITAGASRWARWLHLSVSMLYGRLFGKNLPAGRVLYPGDFRWLKTNEMIELVDRGGPVAERLARMEPRLFASVYTDADREDVARLQAFLREHQ